MGIEETADRLIDEIGLIVEGISVPKDESLSMLPISGLARCARLLRGMIIVRNSDVADVSGIFLRPLIEIWAVSTYLRLGGADAAVELFGDFLGSVKRFPIGADTFQEMVEQWPLDFDRVIFDQLLFKVFRMIDSHEGFPQHREAADLLYLHYRWLSTWESHGSLGSIAGHGDLVGGRAYVRFKRVSHEPIRLVRIGAIFTAILAVLLFDQSGSATESFEGALEQALGGSSLQQLLVDLLNEDLP